MKQSKIYVALAISAFMAALSFLYSSYFACVSFVYLMPLFYVVQKVRVTFWQGFFWGIIFFSFFFIGIIELLCNKAQGQFRILWGIILIVWSALHAGVWFYMGQNSLFLQTNNIGKTIVWCLSTFLFYYYVCNFLFWPLIGIQMGNCFASPLLPLARYPILIYSISMFGKNIMLICLILFQYACINFIFQKNKAWIIIMACSLLPLLFGFFKKKRKPPCWVESIAYIAPPIQSISHPLERAAAINTSIQEILNQKEHVDIFLMPEASCQFCINEFPEILELWEMNALKNKTLVIGAPRREGDKRYNTLYIIQQCRITKYYDKLKLMPLTEYIPNTLNKFLNANELFLYNKKEFSTGESLGVSLEITPHFKVFPKLCSEFFFDIISPDLKATSCPLLVAVNDGWFGMDYFKHLMFLFAITQSILLQKEILYIGHAGGYWIDGHLGSFINL